MMWNIMHFCKPISPIFKREKEMKQAKVTECLPEALGRVAHVIGHQTSAGATAEGPAETV